MRIFSPYLASLILIASSSDVFAVNPAQGPYAGIMGGVSFFSSVTFNTYVPVNGAVIPAKLTYKPWGNGGLDLGYRIDKFRLEGELNYNTGGFDQLRFGINRLRTNNHSFGYRIHGNTSYVAGFFNAYYEMYTPDPDITGVVPYVGLGIGYAHVSSTLSFYNNNVILINSTARQRNSAGIAQGILGMSYFFDDFTSVALDARYATTNRISVIDARVASSSVNLLLNFSFDTPQ